MQFTNSEKLIITMLADIHEKLGINAEQAKLIQQAIYTDNTWALSWELKSIVGDSEDVTPPNVQFVVDVCEMWSIIEDAYEKFDESQKALLETMADPFGKHVNFTGFDGNNEFELLGIASFLVNDMGRFNRFKGRDLNSHHQSVSSYKRMLGEFFKIRPTISNRRLSVEEMAAVLNAKGN